MGAAAIFLLCWTLLASMVKYSVMVSMLPGIAAARLRSGKVGAAKTVALSADIKSVEARIP